MSVLYQAPGSPDIVRDIISSTVGQVLGGLLLALLGYLAFRRTPRTASWNERKAAIYEDIRVLLFRIIEAQKPLSDREEDDQRTLPPMTQQEFRQRQEQSRTAIRAIEAILREHRSMLLAPRAVEILDRMFTSLDSDEVLGTTVPESVLLWVAQQAHRDLVEFIPADVGPDRGVGWRARRFRRWLDLAWHRVKQWRHGVLWDLDMMIDDFRLRTIRPLTQDDVRNPPRTPGLETVEEMETRGLSRVMIQRRLHEQLAADPPPWLPVPLSGPLHAPRDTPEPSPRLHNRKKQGPLRAGDAAGTCAHGVPLTEACRPCGFVVMPKDFAWGASLPEEDRRRRRRGVRPRPVTQPPLPPKPSDSERSA